MPAVRLAGVVLVVVGRGGCDRMESEFSNRLRKLRETARLVKSVEVTSQLMGLSPNMLRMYERGECEPTLSRLKLIADYYGVTVDYLCGIEERE